MDILQPVNFFLNFRHQKPGSGSSNRLRITVLYMNWFRTAQKKEIYLEESQPQDKDGGRKVNNIEPGTVHLNKKELMNTWIVCGT